MQCFHNLRHWVVLRGLTLSNILSGSPHMAGSMAATVVRFDSRLHTTFARVSILTSRDKAEALLRVSSARLGGSSSVGVSLIVNLSKSGSEPREGRGGWHDSGEIANEKNNWMRFSFYSNIINWRTAYNSFHESWYLFSPLWRLGFLMIIFILPQMRFILL